MASSPDSFLDISDSECQNNVLAATDHAISILKVCTQEHSEKTKENYDILDKLGYDVKVVPQDLLKDLKEIFDDNEVFRFNGCNSKEAVTLNPLQILESCRERSMLGEAQRLQSQLNLVLSQLHNTYNKLNMKLEIEKSQAEVLHEKVSEKTAQASMFKGRLEKLHWDHKHLLQNNDVLEKPNYTLEEVKDLHKELIKMKGEIAITKAKMEKYNNLPLSEKEASKQLIQLKQELANVDEEMKRKTTSNLLT